MNSCDIEQRAPPLPAEWGGARVWSSHGCGLLNSPARQGSHVQIQQLMVGFHRIQKRSQFHRQLNVKFHKVKEKAFFTSDLVEGEREEAEGVAVLVPDGMAQGHGEVSLEGQNEVAGEERVTIGYS